MPSLNEQLRERIGAMDIVMTVAPGDAREAAADAAQAGYDTIFIGGGDGTLNQVLNGVASVEGAFSRVTFGVIPLGTGNEDSLQRSGYRRMWMKRSGFSSRDGALTWISARSIVATLSMCRPVDSLRRCRMP